MSLALTHQFSHQITGYFSQNVILFSDVVYKKFTIFVWNGPYIMDIRSVLWLLMVWCISTRTSVATVLSTHPWVSMGLWVHEKDLNIQHATCCILCFIIRDVFRNEYSQGMPRPISSYHDNPPRIRLIANKESYLPGIDEIPVIGYTGSCSNGNFRLPVTKISLKCGHFSSINCRCCLGSNEIMICVTT